MKKKKHSRPTRSKFSVLRQLCNLIPSHLVYRIARQTGVEDKARTFSPWSYVVSMLFAQLTHAIGLNDVRQLETSLWVAVGHSWGHHAFAQ